MTPVYSVIIPHYNIPDLLMRCLKSIPIREDVQVIVVDDNSPGADAYIAKYPELSRPYLEFVRTTKGGGAGYARNVGLDLAKGEWLVFADADDFFSDRFEALMEQFIHSEKDIIYFRSNWVLSDDISQSLQDQNWLDSLFRRYFKTGDETDLRCLNHNPWAKFFKRDYIAKYGFRFSETPYSNDLYFVVSAACTARSIYVCNDILYTYAIRSGSLTDQFSTKKGELAIRLLEATKAQAVYWPMGYRPRRLPAIDLLSKAYHTDRAVFRSCFKKVASSGPGIWKTMTLLRYKEESRVSKLAVYVAGLSSLFQI